MSDRKIQLFLYGSVINLEVLQEAGLRKRAFAPASIVGYELRIQPVANLLESGDGIVFGILSNFTHKEIEKLMHGHTAALTETIYSPEPVIVHTRGGKIVPALTYMADEMPSGRATKDYINSILKAAKSYGFPSSYLDHIKSFCPRKS